MFVRLPLNFNSTTPVRCTATLSSRSSSDLLLLPSKSFHDSLQYISIVRNDCKAPHSNLQPEADRTMLPYIHLQYLVYAPAPLLHTLQPSFDSISYHDLQLCGIREHVILAFNSR